MKTDAEIVKRLGFGEIMADCGIRDAAWQLAEKYRVKIYPMRLSDKWGAVFDGERLLIEPQDTPWQAVIQCVGTDLK